MPADRALRIGVVLEAFLDWPLDQVMPWLRQHAPGFADGAAVQAVCDAMETSAASGRWVSVAEALPNTV